MPQLTINQLAAAALVYHRQNASPAEYQVLSEATIIPAKLTGFIYHPIRGIIAEIDIAAFGKDADFNDLTDSGSHATPSNVVPFQKPVPLTPASSQAKPTSSPVTPSAATPVTASTPEHPTVIRPPAVAPTIPKPPLVILHQQPTSASVSANTNTTKSQNVAAANPAPVTSPAAATPVSSDPTAPVVAPTPATK